MGNSTKLSPRLHSVGGCIPADRPTTWVAPGLQGWLAVPAYVLFDEDTAVVIDSGVAAHRASLAAGLDEVIPNTMQRSFIMTRREPDCIINLPWLVQTFGLKEVYCGGILSPIDFFESFEQKAAEASIAAIAQSELTWLQPGKNIPIGSFNFEMMRAKLSVLPKNYVYESTTKTFFGSDSWGFLTQEHSGSPGVITKKSERLSRASIANYLRYKFDWLLGIDTDPIAQEIRDIRGQFEINRLCPSYGCSIEGPELVDYVLEETIQAVLLLSKEPMADRFQGMTEDLIHRLSRYAVAAE